MERAKLNVAWHSAPYGRRRSTSSLNSPSRSPINSKKADVWPAIRKSSGYLGLVNACDDCPHDPSHFSAMYTLHIPTYPAGPIGFIHPLVISSMPWTLPFIVNHKAKRLEVFPDEAQKQDTAKTEAKKELAEATSEAFRQLLQKSRDKGLYKMLGPKESEMAWVVGTNPPVKIERFASPLFGLVSRGAHMTVFTCKDGELKIWVPRRSAHLLTYPSKLDTTVAGGVKADETPLENLMVEAGEEAGLDAELVKRDARATGCLTYISVTKNGQTHVALNDQEVGLPQPTVVYCYDLEVTPETELEPQDEEVEKFELLGIHEVKERLLREEFKTNSAVVMVDFFVRHGIIRPEEEVDYAEMISGMHRKIPFPTA